MLYLNAYIQCANQSYPSFNSPPPPNCCSSLIYIFLLPQVSAHARTCCIWLILLNINTQTPLTQPSNQLKTDQRPKNRTPNWEMTQRTQGETLEDVGVVKRVAKWDYIEWTKSHSKGTSKGAERHLQNGRTSYQLFIWQRLIKLTI